MALAADAGRRPQNAARAKKNRNTLSRIGSMRLKVFFLLANYP